MTITSICLFVLFFSSDDRSSNLLRNVSKFLPDYMATHPTFQVRKCKYIVTSITSSTTCLTIPKTANTLWKAVTEAKCFTFLQHLFQTLYSLANRNLHLRCALKGNKSENKASVVTVRLYSRAPLWSSGQRCWLQIRRPGFDSRHYQKQNQWVWNGVHSPSWVQLRNYLIEK
jgi:hypothetical protein